MKVVATKKTDPKTAKRLQREIIKISQKFFTYKEWSHVASQLSNIEVLVELPNYYAYYYTCITPEGMALYGTSSGGTYHALIVRNNGRCTVVHEGSRTSYPGLLINIVHNNSEFFNSENKWKLEIYKTSKPSLAPIAGFLLGKFGNSAPKTPERKLNQ